MDLNQLKRLMDKEKAKVIIVENGKPVLMVSRIESYQEQPLSDSAPEGSNPLPFAKDKSIEAKNVDTAKENPEDRAELEAPKQEVAQSTELLAKEEMPSDELTVEDLPF